jgi:hypothetical protein
VNLAELNDSYPIELAEFAKARCIADEPAFACWVPHTFRRRNAILSAVKARVRKKTHKYGIAVPTSLVRAKELDRINGNTLWMDTLKFEMRNVGVAFVWQKCTTGMDEGKWPSYLGRSNGLYEEGKVGPGWWTPPNVDRLDVAGPGLSEPGN